MAQITTVGTIDVGIFINPNTFTRQIAKSYEILGNRINLLSIIFTSGQRAPVRPSDVRWSWNTPSSFTANGAINDSSTGLDGTTIYTYAGADYLLKNPIFLKTNADLITQKRPATIYESFLNMIDYLDLQIATRYSSVVAAAADAVASTGDITFSGVKIIGAGVASGDLLGNSTIDLVPDIDLYNNHQYLVIDPTTINHIHVRAGGTPDDSLATLILGGEKSNVTISDQSTNHVIINSKTEDETTSNVWIFNAEGDLILPISGDIKDSDGNSVLGGGGGSGTVTSVTATSPLSSTEGTTPNISLGVVGVANGGTGRDSLFMNNVILGNSTGAVQQVAPSTSKNILMSDGTTWGSIPLHYESTITTTPTSITMSGYTGYTSTHAVATASIAITINLPALTSTVNGYEIVIFDKDGNASANNITIDPSAGTRFIGMPLNENLVIDTNYGTVGLRKTSLGWLILYTR